MSVIKFVFIILVATNVQGGIYDSYLSPEYYSQGYSYNPYGGLFNPLFPNAPTSLGWPQYGSVSPWSSGGLFGLTRASGHSDRYGGNLGYNYGCIPFCQYGGGLMGR